MSVNRKWVPSKIACNSGEAGLLPAVGRNLISGKLSHPEVSFMGDDGRVAVYVVYSNVETGLFIISTLLSSRNISKF